MNKELNLKILEKLKNINLSKEIKEQLDIYYNFLIEENKKYNLTAITEEVDFVNKHFFDSLIFTSEIKIDDQKICDVGTGAGFPGMVLKILFPKTEITFLESNSKKIDFLKTLSIMLKLEKVNFINQRAEEYSKEKTNYFDIVISRAVAPLNIILEVSSTMVKHNGYFIGLKSSNLFNEIKELNDKENELGLKLFKIQETNFEEIGIRNNIFYKKVGNAKPIYPRAYSQIKKKPLGN